MTTEVAGLIRRTAETFGQLDCALNNAGVGQGSQPLPELPEEVWHRVIAITLMKRLQTRARRSRSLTCLPRANQHRHTSSATGFGSAAGGTR